MDVPSWCQQRDRRNEKSPGRIRGSIHRSGLVELGSVHLLQGNRAPRPGIFEHEYSARTRVAVIRTVRQRIPEMTYRSVHAPRSDISAGDVGDVTRGSDISHYSHALLCVPVTIRPPDATGFPMTYFESSRSQRKVSRSARKCLKTSSLMLTGRNSQP
jgi:hypothetical protein